MTGKKKKESQNNETADERKSRLTNEYNELKKELKKNKLVDLQLTSLHEFKLDQEKAQKLWGGDRRDISVVLQSFIRYNKKALDFLNIQHMQSSTESALILKAEKMVGCAPLISPVNGKQCGNIIVKSEHQDDIDGLIPLIDGNIDLRFNESMPTNRSPFIHPPMYIECIKYIDKYMEAKKVRWQKFSNLNVKQSTPAASTDWGKYASYSYDPALALTYPNRVNRHIIDHPEWQELTYVLSIAIKETLSSRTPAKFRQEHYNKIAGIRQKVSINKQKATKEVRIHRSDPQVICELKNIANNILRHESSASCAWSFDISKFYERYVQYIFQQTMRQCNGTLICNPHFEIKGERAPWFEKYIEPDIVIKQNNHCIMADAKYKSHMVAFNKDSNILKQTFREDMFQILGYSTFSGEKQTTIIICYPCDEAKARTSTIKNPINSVEVKMVLVGIPVQKDKINDAVNCLYKVIIG